LCAVIVFGGFSAPSRADRAGQARQLFEEGAALFETGAFADAIGKFKAADAIAPSAALAFDIAVSYRRLGDCPHALAYYQLYLRREPRVKTVEMEECSRPEIQAAPLVLDEAAQPGHGTRIAGEVTAAAGAVLVVIGLVYAEMASFNADSVEAQARIHGGWSTYWADVQASGRRDAVISAVAVGLGGAALVTGATVFIIGVRKEQRGADVVVSWHF